MRAREAGQTDEDDLSRLASASAWQQYAAFAHREGVRMGALGAHARQARWQDISAEMSARARRLVEMSMAEEAIMKARGNSLRTRGRET